VTAWLSALGDRWNCDTCRRVGFLCSRDGHIDRAEVDRRLAEAPVPMTVPLVFRADAASVCPRVLAGPFGMAVSEAYGWRENGGLGLTFLTAPMWVGQALGQFGSELMKALQFNRKET
jgi:hypothetical protein